MKITLALHGVDAYIQATLLQNPDHLGWLVTPSFNHYSFANSIHPCQNDATHLDRPPRSQPQCSRDERFLGPHSRGSLPPPSSPPIRPKNPRRKPWTAPPSSQARSSSPGNAIRPRP